MPRKLKPISAAAAPAAPALSVRDQVGKLVRELDEAYDQTPVAQQWLKRRIGQAKASARELYFTLVRGGEFK